MLFATTLLITICTPPPLSVSSLAGLGKQGLAGATSAITATRVRMLEWFRVSARTGGHGSGPPGEMDLRAKPGCQLAGEVGLACEFKLAFEHFCIHAGREGGAGRAAEERRHERQTE
jgi:hypothetical protein